MKEESTKQFFIGWDVGGWNCDRNRLSRDAIVILDSQCSLIGQPWRGNLRTHINEARTTTDWVGKLFSLCNSDFSSGSMQINMAIDTPLGFSEEFLRLVSDLKYEEPIGSYDSNCYLFRQTELYLFSKGLSPLSAVKDMIGSQATKGMHTLAKFSSIIKTCGVWTDGNSFQAIEAYPAACKGSKIIKELLRDREPLKPEDLQAALVCALIAYLFVSNRSLLEPPSNHIPYREGWIWIPRDAFDTHAKNGGD